MTPVKRKRSDVVDALCVRKRVHKARDYKMVSREHFKTVDFIMQSSSSSALPTTEEDANQQKHVEERLHCLTSFRLPSPKKRHTAKRPISTKLIKE